MDPDPLIYFPNKTKNLKHLEMVLETLKKLQLFVNYNKCEFGMMIVVYLGHIVVLEHGVSADC